MPPKAKFTKEQIINAAVELVKREGLDALTARALGEELGSSARPIFTVFDSMDAVRSGVILYAKALYAEYVAEGLKEPAAFKGVGKAYIRFACEQPKLFTTLFMRESENVPDTDSVLLEIEGSYDKILKSIEDGYGLNRDASIELYKHLWIYSHGIAALIATKVCNFTEEEISEKLTVIFTSLLRKIKTEINNDSL